MTDALRFEAVRVSTIRSTYLIGLLGLLLSWSPWASGSTSAGRAFPPPGPRFCSLPVARASRSR